MGTTFNFIQLSFHLHKQPQFSGNCCCCTFETFWVLLLVGDLPLLVDGKTPFLWGYGFCIYALLSVLSLDCIFNWEPASALKESKSRLDSATVKRIAVSVGTSNVIVFFVSGYSYFSFYYMNYPIETRGFQITKELCWVTAMATISILIYLTLILLSSTNDNLQQNQHFYHEMFEYTFEFSALLICPVIQQFTYPALPYHI